MFYGLLAAAGIITTAGVWSMAGKNKHVPKNIGVQEGQLADLPATPNAVSSTASQAEKKVEALPFQGTLETSRQQLLQVLRSFENIEIITNEKNYIHATAASKTFKFKDDLEFHLNSEKQSIEVRSAARVGYSDLDMNRKRYEEIRKKYLA